MSTGKDDKGQGLKAEKSRAEARRAQREKAISALSASLRENSADCLPSVGSAKEGGFAPSRGLPPSPSSGAASRRMRLVLSKRLRTFFPQPALEQDFFPFEGRPIRLPKSWPSRMGTFSAITGRLNFKNDTYCPRKPRFGS